MRLSPLRLLSLPLAIVVWASAAAGQAGQGSPDGAARASQAAAARSRELIGGGNFDAAIEVLKAATRAAPDDWQLNYLLGQAYYRKGDNAHAAEFLTKAVGAAPREGAEYRQAVQMLALSRFVLGHFGEALPHLEQLSRWAPENVETAYALGVCYIQTHDTDRSRAAFARMFKVPAGSASAHLINAQMLVRQQFEEFAEKELNRALELDPRLPQANFLLGELAVYHAQIDRGIQLLEKEIAINPTFGMAYYRLGEAYTRQLRWDEAVAPLQKSIWLNPYFSGPYIVLGKVYLKKDDLQNAEGILRRALQMDPNNFSGHHLLAQVLQRANRPEEARKEFELAERLRAGAEGVK